MTEHQPGEPGEPAPDAGPGNSRRGPSGGPRQYEIRVREALDARWSHWFDGLAATHVGADGTILAGELADQEALYGVLARLRDLNCTLLSVTLVEAHTTGRQPMARTGTQATP